MKCPHYQLGDADIWLLDETGLFLDELQGLGRMVGNQFHQIGPVGQLLNGHFQPFGSVGEGDDELACEGVNLASADGSHAFDHQLVLDGVGVEYQASMVIFIHIRA